MVESGRHAWLRAMWEQSCAGSSPALGNKQKGKSIMAINFEKSYDDLVYDDNFYEENFNKNIKNEDNENTDDQTGKIEVLLLCEECDNQWEDAVEEKSTDKVFCPMCGANKIIQM